MREFKIFLVFDTFEILIFELKHVFYISNTLILKSAMQTEELSESFQNPDISF